MSLIKFVKKLSDEEINWLENGGRKSIWKKQKELMTILELCEL